MKKIIVVLLLIWGSTINAQNVDLNQIKLAVITPDMLLEDLTANHVSKIQTKIQRMVSNYGMSGTDYINDFVIYPKFEIYSHDVIPGSFGDLHSIEAELTLLVVDAKTKSLLAAGFPIELKGESRDSRKDAITKSISRIKTKGDAIDKFMNTIKDKIISYYQSNCNRVYKEADVMLKNGLIADAINVLLTVPSGLSGDCYDKIQTKLLEAYIMYNNYKCKTVIAEAQAAIEKQEIDYAKGLLEQIGQSSSCFSVAQNLLKRINASNKKENPTPSSDKVKAKLEKRKVTVLKKTQKETAEKDDKEQLCDLGIGNDCD